MTAKWSVATGLAGAVAFCHPAVAAPLSALDILDQFNAVVFGTFATTADVEGRTVVGGNMTRGATFNIAPGSAAASAYPALTVYGNQTGNGSYNVNNGGGMTIAGTNAGSFMLNGGGSATIGGANSANLNTSGGSASVSIGGSNTGTVNLSAGGSVFVGGSSTGQLTVNGGTGSISVTGAATSSVTLNNGGSIYVGSNSSGGNLSVNGGSGAVSVNSSNAAQITLNNGGTAAINGNTGNVNMNGGALTYTGSITGNLNLNGGASATHVANAGITPPATPSVSLPSFTSSFQDQMTGLSAQLDTLTANSVAQVAGNAITFVANPDRNGLAVFDVNTSLFAPNSTVSIQLNDATTVIVNVNVDSCVVNNCTFAFGSSVNFQNPNGYAEKVLWNSPTPPASPSRMNLAAACWQRWRPSATRDDDGTLVAASYNGNGELHSRPFSGSFAAPLTPGNNSVNGCSRTLRHPGLFGRTGRAGLGAAADEAAIRWPAERCLTDQSGTPASDRLVRWSAGSAHG